VDEGKKINSEIIPLLTGTPVPPDVSLVLTQGNNIGCYFDLVKWEWHPCGIFIEVVARKDFRILGHPEFVPDKVESPLGTYFYLEASYLGTRKPVFTTEDGVTLYTVKYGVKSKQEFWGVCLRSITLADFGLDGCRIARVGQSAEEFARFEVQYFGASWAAARLHSKDYASGGYCLNFGNKPLVMPTITPTVIPSSYKK
jgi:hypothetical protein